VIKVRVDLVLLIPGFNRIGPNIIVILSHTHAIKRYKTSNGTKPNKSCKPVLHRRLTRKVV
jgi:hypothetical protein